MQSTSTTLVTGGAGFIGSHLVRTLLQQGRRLVNVDKLTYAGNLHSLADLAGNSQHHFVHADVCNTELMVSLLQQYQPEWVFHLAAESHVDRSIDRPLSFVQTNVLGTASLLQASLDYWQTLPFAQRQSFRFIHVSTDEVFGSLGKDGNGDIRVGEAFGPASCYAPRSPYAASKASADHLVRAWNNTYQFPAIVTNCTNNFGPNQFPEKLIPVVVLRALRGEPLPVYGDGKQVRDWIFVVDHVDALISIAEQGRPQQTYLIGARHAITNLQLVMEICSVMDRVVPHPSRGGYAELITFVQDRPGHDFAYRVDPSQTEQEIDWRPKFEFSQALENTIRWYIDHPSWWQAILDGSYTIQRQGLASSDP